MKTLKDPLTYGRWVSRGCGKVFLSPYIRQVSGTKDWRDLEAMSNLKSTKVGDYGKCLL